MHFSFILILFELELLFRTCLVIGYNIWIKIFSITLIYHSSSDEYDVLFVISVILLRGLIYDNIYDIKLFVSPYSIYFERTHFVITENRTGWIFSITLKNENNISCSAMFCSLLIPELLPMYSWFLSQYIWTWICNVKQIWNKTDFYSKLNYFF